MRKLGELGVTGFLASPFAPCRDRVNHAFVGPFFGDPAPVCMVTRCQNKSSDGIWWETNKLSGPTWIGRESDGYKLRDQETSSLHVRRCSDQSVSDRQRRRPAIAMMPLERQDVDSFVSLITACLCAHKRGIPLVIVATGLHQGRTCASRELGKRQEAECFVMTRFLQGPRLVECNLKRQKGAPSDAVLAQKKVDDTPGL